MGKAQDCVTRVSDDCKRRERFPRSALREIYPYFRSESRAREHGILKRDVMNKDFSCPRQG